MAPLPAHSQLIRVLHCFVAVYTKSGIDPILLVCDGAAWHKSKGLKVPGNIKLLHIPPYTPEMNPIEQIWRELRTQGFKNEVFPTLKKVVDRLCVTINNLTKSTVSKITLRHWISVIFN